MRYGDRIHLTVLLNGVDVTASVERFRARFGFDMRVAECDVQFALTPSFSDWGTLVVSAGLVNSAGLVVPETGSLPTGNVVRFNGLAVDRGVDFWPYTPKLAGRGYLTVADRSFPPDDAWADQLAETQAGQLAVPARFQAPGIDMTDNGNGQTDSQQILAVLDRCGLTLRVQTYPTDIAGLGYLLGTQTKAYEQFCWRRGQSGLSYIESLDAMYGYRTFDTPAGYVLRKLVSNLVPLFATVQYTVNENTNILEGAAITRDIEMIRNRIEVTGWDHGDGTNVWVAIGAASPLPPGVTILTDYLSNSFIEKIALADSGDGLSSEETADFWLGQLQYPMFEVVVPTWRDDPFKPGDIVYVNAPHLLGVNQATTLKHLEIEVTPNTFTQYLTCRAQDYSVFRGPPLLPLGLPERL